VALYEDLVGVSALSGVHGVEREVIDDQEGRSDVLSQLSLAIATACFESPVCTETNKLGVFYDPTLNSGMAGRNLLE
jgi:hypothetical protein